MRSFITCYILFMLGLATTECRAQVWPANGSNLNYRLAPFAWTEKGKGTYKFEVATGNVASAKDFERSICRTSEASSNHTIIELPEWGADYTWRVTFTGPKNKVTASALYHFSTMKNAVTDTAACRLRVAENKGGFDGYIFLDRNYTLYNAAGEPLWFLPRVDSAAGQISNIRDLKITNAGTITFLLNDWPYETDYNGRVLWKGVHEGVVSGDTAEHYHHELTRLSTGHYMVMGNEMLRWRKDPLPPHLTNEREIRSYEERISFGTLIEYDKWGNTKWQWKSSAYYYDTQMYYKQPLSRLTDIHQNSFYFDELQSVIYTSFKNISQVMKISYPTGKVLGVYGSKGHSLKGDGDKSMFCHQHSCRATHDGYLYLYNNNICNRGSAPTIVMIKVPENTTDTAEKFWEFTCPVLPGQGMGARKPFATNGGNILERPDGSFFVSMCAPHAHVFIVTRDKQITYSAVPENKLPGFEGWEPTTQYRASIVNSRAELEKLVLSAIPGQAGK